MADTGPFNLATTYLRLRPDNSAEPLTVQRLLVFSLPSPSACFCCF